MNNASQPDSVSERGIRYYCDAVIHYTRLMRTTR